MDRVASFFWLTVYISGAAEARHLKFGMQIDINRYQRTQERFLPKGICQESRDLILFRGITDDVSETV